MKAQENTSWCLKEEPNVSAEFEITNRILIIKMKEDLDHHNAIYIREQADKLLVNKNIVHVIFDFTKVSFMDSSGIGVILGRYKKLRLLGQGQVAVIGVSEGIHRILNMSGIYKVVKKYNTLTEATNKLESL